MSSLMGLQRLRRALGYAVHADSWLALGVLALLLALADRLAALWAGATVPLAVAGRLIFLGYFYLVLRKASAGSLRLPRPRDYRDAWATLAFPLLQGAVLALWYWLPLLWCAERTIGLGDFAHRLQLRAMELLRMPRWQSLVWLWFELFCVPAVLTTAAGTQHCLRLVWPPVIWRHARRGGRAFLALVATLQGVVVGMLLLHAVGGLLEDAVPVPFAAPLMTHLFACWAALIQARLLGDFVAEQARAERAQARGP
ncbi:MAG: hypothetical protein IPL40_16335 [Proteobacteria bacterium]|nr:hypothetical protein [Pseudomonadota bacterium]